VLEIPELCDFASLVPLSPANVGQDRPASACNHSVLNPRAAKTAESKAASSAAHGGGTHEGIHVHGYWTIEVRNPDGI
jgi:hypothetical protein